MKRLISLVLTGVLLVTIFSCDSETRNARLEVYLTDAPGDYQHVNIDVVGVEVHSSAGDTETGWTKLDVEGGVYDLLELTNGLDTLLGVIELPPGKISQLRLKLGSNNSIVVGGKTHPLKTPSAMQSGLKLQIHKTLTEGITYKILLDFDVARSVVQKGNGSYSLKPVIRTITEAQDGAIRGTVEPAASTPAIYAISGIDTVGTTYSDENGKFLIRGLSSGSYTVSISPNGEYVGITLENVPVSVGQVTQLATVTLETN